MLRRNFFYTFFVPFIPKVKEYKFKYHPIKDVNLPYPVEEYLDDPNVETSLHIGDYKKYKNAWKEYTSIPTKNGVTKLITHKLIEGNYQRYVD